MAEFRIVYEIGPGGDSRIELRGDIERTTLYEALEEFYEECGNMVNYKEPTDFAISRRQPGGNWEPVKLCPECEADGSCEMCEACGGTGEAA